MRQYMPYVDAVSTEIRTMYCWRKYRRYTPLYKTNSIRGTFTECLCPLTRIQNALYTGDMHGIVYDVIFDGAYTLFMSTSGGTRYAPYIGYMHDAVYDVYSHLVYAQPFFFSVSRQNSCTELKIFGTEYFQFSASFCHWMKIQQEQLHCKLHVFIKFLAEYSKQQITLNAKILRIHWSVRKNIPWHPTRWFVHGTREKSILFQRHIHLIISID